MMVTRTILTTIIMQLSYISIIETIVVFLMSVETTRQGYVKLTAQTMTPNIHIENPGTLAINNRTKIMYYTNLKPEVQPTLMKHTYRSQRHTFTLL